MMEFPGHQIKKNCHFKTVTLPGLSGPGGATFWERVRSHMILDVVIKAYPPECKNLVDIWTNYARYNFTGIDVITFVKKRPKNPRTNNRRIAGLPAQCVSYLRNDEELVKMSVEDFLCLMAKCGVDVEIKDVIKFERCVDKEKSFGEVEDTHGN
jgi:hypothetical protein